MDIVPEGHCVNLGKQEEGKKIDLKSCHYFSLIVYYTIDVSVHQVIYIQSIEMAQVFLLFTTKEPIKNVKVQLWMKAGFENRGIYMIVNWVKIIPYTYQSDGNFKFFMLPISLSGVRCDLVPQHWYELLELQETNFPLASLE